MLTKFDSKSNRVKGLTFHPTRPFILASLHNGVVQLWDYRMGVLIDRYEEHDGPVRGIDFHKSQPLFVSGGDDYKIKVWNYKLRRCLFTLLGHLDYIRTVQFHHEYPWIVSASDDQTIRIWNWQSRTCISVLTGHNHYVMCASFHPREDLIVSASLDQSVRVWDTSGLRRKTVRGAPADESSLSITGRVNTDLFFANDSVVKYVLEGHDRGVNWAAFHPTQNLIVSGADDRQVKLWRMNETKAWEMDTLRGHTNNVSCVLFHAKHDLVISNSEDRSIRVWDVQKRMCVQTFRRESDRFWMLAVHPEQNLIAAGHDSGMVVFKLERERPAYGCGSGNQMFYVKDRYLRRAIVGAASDVPLASLRARGSGLGSAPRTLVLNQFNPSGEDNVLVLSPADGGCFDLYNVSGSAVDAPEAGRGAALAAVFTARSKFAYLDKATRTITVRALVADPGKRVRPPYAQADLLFPASTTGRLLIRCEDRVCLFELQSRRVVAEIAGVVVKYVVWSADGSHVALLGKHAVVLADKDLTQICSVTETVRVKSGVWDESGVFIYTTLNHVKYLLPLPTGDSGIVRTLDAPMYATAVRGGQLFVLDRECRHRALPIDPTEHQFKLALARRQFDRVLAIIRSARLVGQSVIAYLQRAGYPEVALFFVEDDLTRFNLALDCGNLEIALKAAKAVNSEEAWARLASEALRQGNTEIVELAYQTSKSLDRLSFLYLLTGSREKLAKMGAIAAMRGDGQARYHNALYCGSVEERIKVLEGAGQTALAYVTASTYGLEAEAARLKGYLEEAGLPLPTLPASRAEAGASGFLDAGAPQALLPPTPIYRNGGSWPSQPVAKAAFDPAHVAAMAAAATANGPGTGGAAAVAAVAAAAVAAAAAEERREAEEAAAAARAAERAAAGGDADDLGDESGGWGDDLDLGGLEGGKKAGGGAPGEAGGGSWGDDLDLDLGGADGDDESPAGHKAGGAGFAVPTGGTPVPSYWVQNSSCAADHVAAGSWESAMQLLNRQVGIVNFAPLKPGFGALFAASRASCPSLPSLPSSPVFITRNEVDGAPPRERTLPAIATSLAQLQGKVAALHRAFTEGKFGESNSLCDGAFALIPLLVVATKQEAAEVKSLLKAVTEYKTAARIMLTAKAHPTDDAPRQMELAAYMTHCALEPAHLMLALNLAMSMAYKHGNFIHAAGFARRLLELPDITAAKNAALATKAKKVLQAAEGQARNAHAIAYDEASGASLCAASLTPIPKGAPLLRSPFSGAAYQPSFKGSVCVVDGMAQVGVETLGLVCSLARK